MGFAPLTEVEERIAKAIVNACFRFHSTLGPGLIEGVYEVCVCHELAKAGFKVRRQQYVSIKYDNITIKKALRLDILVNDLVICEVKAVLDMHPVFEAQLLTYLKLTDKRLGFLVNFNVPLIKDGIQRFIR
ncbi:MAG TPA: GxxExxY protein [Pirellulaceae bacterium]|nr:GxxExxY protein [Pirellulaceae bacterium]